MGLWFFSPLDDPAAWTAALRRELPDLEITTGPRPRHPERCRFALVDRPPPGALAALPRLEAIFSLAAGVDGLLADPTLPADLPLCRMVDPALAETMADYAQLAVLRVHRGFDGFARDQRTARWGKALPRRAREVGVAVLGLGEIGGVVARRLAGCGYRVTGWSRAPKSIANVATFAGFDALGATVEEAEIVIAILPATAATRDLFDAAFFRAMRPGAHFVNIGRGDQLVEGDLLDALDQGRLGGATLDVFKEEPLPAEHPFWRHPSILVTPHIAGSTLPETGAAAVAAQLRRAAAGLPLRHVVDRGRGY